MLVIVIWILDTHTFKCLVILWSYGWKCFIYSVLKSVKFLRGGNTQQNKKKKSNKHGSRNAYFLWYVHLSLVVDVVWLWVHLHDRQGKRWGNKFCMVTVVAEGQTDALLWTDVTLSTSYNKCHECTSGWTFPMNKCRTTGHRKYAFPDPCVGPNCLFFILWYVVIGHFCF